MGTLHNVFIFSGGKGKRMGIFKKNNVKAFAKVNSKKILINHIENINKYLNVKKIFVIITEKKGFFEDQLKQFDNVEIISNKKDYTFKGIISGLNLIEEYVKNDEHFIIFLADEYYDEKDFNEFCLKAKQIKKNESLIAIKKFRFPQEYFKNYSVSIDKKDNLLTETEEKNSKRISEYFGTGLMCLSNNLFKILKKITIKDHFIRY